MYRFAGVPAAVYVVAAMALIDPSTSAHAQDAAPGVMTRDKTGRPTVRATRISERLRIDGELNEAVYDTVPSFGDFIQALPKTGVPATERTDVWVMFDEEALYISARCWDSGGAANWVANEMRRDLIGPNDNFSVVLDTFHDRRNGYLLQTNPLAARSDAAMTDEGGLNRDWNPVWDVRTAIFEGGWTLEVVVPFKSLRYRSGTSQTWGLQFRRLIRWKNEWTYLSPMPAEIGGSPGLARISMGGNLVGLDLPDAGRSVEIKPYAIAKTTTNRNSLPPIAGDTTSDAGLDLKYGITANLTADLTYRTDFAQVEVDEQQVNLTRFSVFFPEKREFFLEGRGIFDFSKSAAGGDTPTLFYTRRIGLNRGRTVPLTLGGRVTGKVGRLGVGVMHSQTGDEEVSRTPSTNFTVVRLKRDIFRRSTVGIIATNRSVSNVAAGSNQAYGVDAAFGLLQNLNIDGYLARTRTPGVTRKDGSYQARLDFSPDLYGARVEHLYVGDNFSPEIGFVRRDNFRRTVAYGRYSPRPQSDPLVRKLTWEGTFTNIESGDGVPESRQEQARFISEFHNSDQFTLEATRDFEQLLSPFRVAPAVTIPVGRHTFTSARVAYAFGQQRRMSGSLAFLGGTFYNGSIRSLVLSGSRVSLTPRLSVEPSVTLNRVSLPAGRFTTTLLRTRGDIAFTPRMFASALVQYSSTDRSLSSNFRFRWEYLPGSEAFVVYTDERDTALSGFPQLKNRALVVKVNRLIRF